MIVTFVKYINIARPTRIHIVILNIRLLDARLHTQLQKNRYTYMYIYYIMQWLQPNYGKFATQHI